MFLQKLTEILANLKKIQRNLQCSLFYAEFYEEFNGASCQIFLLGQKKVLSKNEEAGILLKTNFFYGQCFKCWSTKMSVTTTSRVKQLFEIEEKVKFIWDNISSEL